MESSGNVGNGRSVILVVFGCIIVGSLLAFGSCIWERQETLRTLQEIHVQLPGHPVMMQKMLMLEEIVKDMREDLKEMKELLRRSKHEN